MIKLWWSHKHKQYRKKRFNLKQVPEKYRCPTCGKILVKPKDRSHMITDKKDWERRYKKIKELLAIEKPTKAEWKDFCKRHDALFTPKLIPSRDWPIIELSLYGGVCKDCWLDGLGKYGKLGKFYGYMLSPEGEQREQQIINEIEKKRQLANDSGYRAALHKSY